MIQEIEELEVWSMGGNSSRLLHSLAPDYFSDFHYLSPSIQMLTNETELIVQV
jgi:hypothetical protein